MLPLINSASIQIAGNAAGTGAIMTLCDDKYLLTLQELAKSITVIELTTNTEFQQTFVKHLDFSSCKG
jgi:uncharacterized 2Fe-2S/4Fe-4S cluster protein (DUF4445 family)